MISSAMVPIDRGDTDSSGDVAKHNVSQPVTQIHGQARNYTNITIHTMYHSAVGINMARTDIIRCTIDSQVVLGVANVHVDTVLL